MRERDRYKEEDRKRDERGRDRRRKEMKSEMLTIDPLLETWEQISN